jgi:hypothetical protein
VAKHGYFQGFFALFELFLNLAYREKQGKLGIKNAHENAHEILNSKNGEA